MRHNSNSCAGVAASGGYKRPWLPPTAAKMTSRERRHGAVRPQRESQGCSGRSRAASVNEATQDERLNDKEQSGEQHPHADHQVHPPVFAMPKALPQIVPIKHVKPAQQHQHKAMRTCGANRRSIAPSSWIHASGGFAFIAGRSTVVTSQTPPIHTTTARA